MQTQAQLTAIVQQSHQSQSSASTHWTERQQYEAIPKCFDYALTPIEVEKMTLSLMPELHDKEWEAFKIGLGNKSEATRRVIDMQDDELELLFEMDSAELKLLKAADRYVAHAHLSHQLLAQVRSHSELSRQDRNACACRALVRPQVHCRIASLHAANHAARDQSHRGTI